MPGDEMQTPSVQSAPLEDFVEFVAAPRDRFSRWQPSIGPETLALLKGLDLPAANRAESEDRIRTQAVRILARCVPPTEEVGSEVGLVVGYVQSGKTISFTTVAALARDNGYQMVIVIAGTSLPLLRQCTERLAKDLQFASRRARKWHHFSNPTPVGVDGTHIQNTLADWDDADVPRDQCKTVLITVMKHHGHLDGLTDLLASLPMHGRPVLVIDDEADQAGMNTAVRRKEESTTYSRLLRLRKMLPHHAFLQYTATPQAPLLINLIDVLSPRFAEVLEPGADYVGGRDMFIIAPGVVETIPDHDIPSPANILDSPPESLLSALRLFFLGTAAGLILDGGNGNRSMLVHPSQLTMTHGQYFTWVRSVLLHWGAVLELPAGDPDRVELLADFESSCEDLSETVGDLPVFAELAARLRRAIRQTKVEEVNARGGTTPAIGWGGAYSHILVGGQAMDRGFTVEGLTVTYMPRGIGVGNADNVQQRARFLGYKRGYLGYCRVFLEGAVRDAFRSYVAHEEDIRSRLQAHSATGKPLTAWKREFFLASGLKPCRRSVLGLDYMRLTFGDEWWYPGSPQDSADAVSNNREVVERFVEALLLIPDGGHSGRTDMMKHQVDHSVPLAVAYASLLAEYTVVAPSDSPKYTALLIQVKNYVDDNPDAVCSVYVMSSGKRRERGLEPGTGEIKNLFQGAHPNKAGAVYPGDAKIRAVDGLTIQIHSLDVDLGGQSVATDVPVLAIWIPSEMAQDLVLQDQPIPS